MTLTCTVSRRANGKWLARHSGSSTGQVEVTTPTREKVLTKMRDELQSGRWTLAVWVSRITRPGRWTRR
jgi:hypothetical protein